MVCCGAYPYVQRGGGVVYPFGDYEIDPTLPHVPTLKGRGERLSCIRHKATGERVKLQAEVTCSCTAASSSGSSASSAASSSGSSDGERTCTHPHYWHVHLVAGRRRATASCPWERARTVRVQYGRLLTALLRGLPAPHAELGSWLVHHKREPMRVKIDGVRVRVNDDSSLDGREWELRGPHTAHHNRQRRKRRQRRRLAKTVLSGSEPNKTCLKTYLNSAFLFRNMFSQFCFNKYSFCHVST